MIDNKIGWQLTQPYLQLHKMFYQRILPHPVVSPSIFILNEDLAKELGLNPMYITPDYLCGNTIDDAEPIALAYAGHQYGYFNMLGDGRAILLGTQKGYELQFKGSGPTKYSRRGDGRATLSAMLREYIISEAMYHLNVPTTRSLSVTATNDKIQREQLEDGAVLIRVSQSHLRVGSFQYAATKNAVKELADFALNTVYTDLKARKQPYHALLKHIIEKQASLVAQWQSIGFIHGVLNTDNVSIVGETIDYGPCAFMDEYHEKTVFSSIDQHGRYAYDQQPVVTQWNLARLAECFIPLLNKDEKIALEEATQLVESFMPVYEMVYLSTFSKKLGTESLPKSLIDELLIIMSENHLDFTNTFYDLTIGKIPSVLEDWSKKWLEYDVDVDMMKAHNPWIIPRNHLVDHALKASVNGDKKPLKALLIALKTPYCYKLVDPKFQQLPKENERVNKTYCGT